MADIKEVSEGRTKKRRITQQDWQFVAEFIMDELQRRKNRRKDKKLDEYWDDIDRQIEMIPDESHKTTNKQPDKNKAWMAAMEMPHQAQTLEVLTADTRRMTFPDSGPWFSAHSNLTDEYLNRLGPNGFASVISGDTNDVPSLIDQDAADKFVIGFINWMTRQYDLAGNLDLINAEAFKYGMGIGRMNMVSKTAFINTSSGITRENVIIPVFSPRSIRNTYLDDSEHAMHNEGVMVGPATINEFKVKYVDLVSQAERGSSEPTNPRGGWMPAALKGIDGGTDGQVELVEYEGDLVIPRKTTRSLFIPGAIVTVVVGKSDQKAVQRVLRFRLRKMPFTSYLEFPYHREDLDNPYAASPLLKGRPIQLAMTDAMNKLMDAGALDIQPVLQYDSDDPNFIANGGPRIFPGAQMGTTGEVTPLDIGNPQTALAVFVQLVQLYENVTGVSLPRLGAQTKSHTTAFAKDAELNRGVVRTVDYVRSTNKGPLTRMLHMMYEMGKGFRGERTFYIEEYGGFVDIESSVLPDQVEFQVFGAGGPEESAQKMVERFQAAQQAIGLETLKAQLGQQPSLNIDELQKQIMLEGGWTDVDQFFNADGQGVSAGAPGAVAPGGIAPGAQQQALRAITG